MPEPISLQYDIAADDYQAAGAASNNVKETLKMLGLPSPIIRRAAIITYEAEMNLVIHAGGGMILAYIDEDCVEIKTVDQGPGIANVELALKEGFFLGNADLPFRIPRAFWSCLSLALSGMGLPSTL